METAREREAAAEGLEGQLEAAKGLADSLRRARDEAAAEAQVSPWGRLQRRAWGSAHSCLQALAEPCWAAPGWMRPAPGGGVLPVRGRGAIVVVAC